jgi:hypothetical protein
MYVHTSAHKNENVLFADRMQAQDTSTRSMSTIPFFMPHVNNFSSRWPDERCVATHVDGFLVELHSGIKPEIEVVRPQHPRFLCLYTIPWCTEYVECLKCFKFT